MRATTIALVLVSACAAEEPGDMQPPDDDDDDGMGSGSDTEVDPCATPVAVPLSGRPVDLMPMARLAEVASRMPCIAPGSLRDVVESKRTLWYDKTSLTPGYQDSFGDNVVTPIGMRPNTIDPGLINLAVPGGHQQIFVSLGTFHFPFGRPIGDTTNVEVVDFWHVPEAAGSLLPVVHWQRDPNEYTHRVEWMFPAGTVFGELLFLVEGETRFPFEIRTRTRTVDGWVNDVHRPFPAATDLATAVEQRRTDKPEWAESAELDKLVGQLSETNLAPFRVAATHFPGAFPARDSGIDVLPALAGSDADLMHELLLTTAYRSARGIVWKQAGNTIAYAAAAAGPGSIVPKGYNAAAISVDDTSCTSCHRDAGRPFETWYDNILAYGELWGNDEIFTWHPFTISRFVNSSGAVVNFNHDNRQIRPDFAAAGLVAPYSPSQHPATVYKRIVREWTDFRY
ncbi:MAG TPA: hypothetical protein VIV11_41210 [Kofleriaceae bacterium]